MKTKSVITRDVEQRVLQLLTFSESFHSIAMKTSLHPTTVEDIAQRHGWPDLQKLEEALAWMDREDAATTMALPTGETIAQVGDTGRALRSVPVASLLTDPENPRDGVGDIEELAASIKAVGLLQPIVARQRAGQLVIVAGHRRHAAVTHLGWSHVDVIVTRDMRPDEVLAAMLVENGQRRDLDPIEEARAMARLKTLEGINSKTLAARLGKAQATVDGRLRLLDLPPEDQDKVRAGQMPVGHATEKARVLSGNVRPGGGRVPHLGVDHDLAGKARARCTKVHQLKKSLVGKTACGDCWEQVIRAHERHTLTLAAAELGAVCATCGHTEGETR